MEHHHVHEAPRRQSINGRMPILVILYPLSRWSWLWGGNGGGPANAEKRRHDFGAPRRRPKWSKSSAIIADRCHPSNELLEELSAPKHETYELFMRKPSPVSCQLALQGKWFPPKRKPAHPQISDAHPVEKSSPNPAANPLHSTR
jgi:hypothetical protein